MLWFYFLNSPKNLPFLSQNTDKLCKNWIITLKFKKNTHCFAENWQQSLKLVIRTLTPHLFYHLENP
jgi:hypothetical protein